MAKKKDPSVTYLNKFGYNVVKLPRAGIMPLDVIGKDETTQWLGSLSNVWKSSVAVPVPTGPTPAPWIAGQKTDKLDLGFGVKILANALAAFGATVPSIEFAYQKANSVQFAYTDVITIDVSPFEAGNYLVSGTLNTNSPVVEHYFLSPECEAFLITSALQSDSITVTATDSSGVNVSLDVPAIQGVLGANVKVSPSTNGTSTLTFKGPQPVTFGFIANAIEFDGTKWSMRGLPAGGANAFPIQAGAAGPAAPLGEPVILSTGCLVRI